MQRFLCTVLLILSLVLPPQLCQGQTQFQETKQFIIYLTSLIQAGNLEQAVILITSNPQLARVAFQYVYTYLKSSPNNPNRSLLLKELNLIALTFQELGQPDLAQQLASDNLLLTTPYQQSGQSLPPENLSAVKALLSLDPTLTIPCSTLEANSGLLADPRYLRVKFALNRGAYYWAIYMLTPLIDDHTLTPAQKTLVQLRYCAASTAAGMNDWVNDTDQVETLANNAPLEERIGLYIAAIRAAARSGQLSLALKFLEKAKSLLPQLPSPNGNPARFIINSLQFDVDFIHNPDLPASYITSQQQSCLKLLTSTPAGLRLPPLMWQWALEEISTTWVRDTLRWASIHNNNDPSVKEFVTQNITDLSNIWVNLANKNQASPTLEYSIAITMGALAMAEEIPNAQFLAGFLKSFTPAIKRLISIKQQCEQQVFCHLPADQQKFAKGNILGRILASYHALKAKLIVLQHRAQLSPEDFSRVKDHINKSIYLYRESLTPLKAIDSLNALAAVIEQVKPTNWTQEVIALTEVALKKSEQLSYQDGKIDSLTLRAQAFIAQKEKKKALQDLLQAKAIVENTYIDQLSLSSQGANLVRKLAAKIYDTLLQLQLESGQSKEALATLNTRLQLESMASIDLNKLNKAGPTIKNLQETQQRSQALEKQLNLSRKLNLPQNLKRAENLLATTKAEFIKIRDRLKKQLKSTYDRYFKLSPIDLARSQKDLPTDTALVSYFFTADSKSLYIFLIKHDSFRVHRVDIKPGEVTELVKQFRKLCADYIESGAAEFSWQDPKLGLPLLKNLSRLHSILIAPIIPDLKGVKVIAYIPMGILRYLPLQAAAQVDKNDTISFVAQRYMVVTLSQAGDLSQLKEKPGRPQGILCALGNPDGSLRAAEKEVLTLKNFFPNAKVFVEKEASKNKLLAFAPQSSYLHLATHGVLDSRNPDKSYLILAGNEKLTRYDIINHLELDNTRLVTLSACETNLGERNPGTEVTSMAQTFWLAGTRAVLASLWKVSDDSTQKWMEEFYRNLKEGKNLAQAMQAAQIKLINSPNYFHPYHWAAFVLWGDWR